MKPDSALSSPPRASARDWNRSLIKTALVGLILLILGLVLYRDFVFGDKTLLYKDIGSDSINISYPYYVLLSDYLRQVGVPSWSFRVGMGQNLYPYVGTVLISPVIWLAKGLIAKALVYQHLLYVVIAGVLFAQFLIDRGLGVGSSLLGAILSSFSAYMCMGSCWYFHATEVVCFVFLLFAAERAVGRGRWAYLVLAVALVGLLGAFHLYLAALLLSFYVPARLVERYSWQPMLILRVCLVLAAVVAVGVGLGAIITLPNLYGLLNSPRGSGSVSSAATLSSFPVFGLESNLHYITAALRPFANDLLGTGTKFRGWQNYLEAPVTYCGLFCLLIFPQVFIAAKPGERVIYGLLLGAIVVPTLFPWFRYLFWGFRGDYYRVFSLFSILGIITLSMTAFSRYTHGAKVNFWLLAVTIIALMAMLYLPLKEMQRLIDPDLRRTVTLFLISYTILLAAGQLMKRQSVAAWAIIGLAALELIHFSRITVLKRDMVTKRELSQRIGYNDETVDAVRDLKIADDSFFRIDKTWPSGLSTFYSLNDAMVFGYYGTASYSSFNNLNYINFLLALDAISARDAEEGTRWSYGLLGRPLLSGFACEKYLLANDPVPFQVSDQYEFVNRYGNIYLFRNKRFLPLGLTYSRCIAESAFLQMSTDEKAQALLHAVVLSGRNEMERLLPQVNLADLRRQMLSTPLPDTIGALRTKALQIQSFSQTQIEGTVRLDEKSVLVLQTPFDRGWRAYQDGRAAPVLKVDAGLLGVVLDAGEHEVKLRYHIPLVFAGMAVTWVSLLILAASLWRWPRVRLPA
jgi:uncharacterized membrane protein YfhO